MSIKLDRLNHILTEEISKVISEEVKDTDVQFVTITAVDISSDLSYVSLYTFHSVLQTQDGSTAVLKNSFCHKLKTFLLAVGQFLIELIKALAISYLLVI